MVLLLIFVFGGTVPLKAQDGTIDGSFGSTGTVTTSIGPAGEQATSVALQSDGKIVVTGYFENGFDLDFAVVRYNSNGSLDSTFNDSGKVITSLNSGYEEGRGIAVQSDGKIVVAGYTTNGGDAEFAVLRYNSNGSLDDTFDGDGIVTTDLGANSEEPYNVAIQSDGKIVVVGYKYNGANSDFAIVRYNSNGSLDVTFNGTGKVITGIGSLNEEAKGIAFQSNGKIVVAGHSDGDATILRYTTDGSLDTSFNSTGILTIDVASDYEEAYNVALQSDGKIVVGGYTNVGSYYNVLLIRMDSTGAIDPTFDGDGKVSTDIGTRNEEAKSIAIQSDGKIVVAGYYDNGSNTIPLMIRYNSNGTVDNSFASNGIDTTAMSTDYNIYQDIVLQTNNKIVVVGMYYNGTDHDFALRRFETDGSIDGTLNPLGKAVTSILNDSWINATAVQSDDKIIAGGIAWDGSQNYFAVARYSSNGALDPTFGSVGIVTTAVGTSDDGIYSIAVQSDGKIVAAGYSKNGSNVYRFAVVRYDSTGALDNTFGTNGKVTTLVGSGSNWGYGVAIQADGKIVIVGDADNQLVLVRYTTTGALDTGFDGDGIVNTTIGSSSNEGKAITIQSDGKIIAVGNCSDGSNSDFAVVRYNSNGSLDTTFNADGKTTTAFGAEFDQAFAVAVQEDGKIVVAGNMGNGSNSDYAVARYTANGILDSTFSTDGKVVTAIGSSDDDGKSVVIQSDGKIIVAGDTFIETDTDLGVIRYNTDGSIDNTFGTNGIAVTAIESSYDRVGGMALQSAGNIVVGGYAYVETHNVFAVVRYISSSSPVISLSYSAAAFSESAANSGSIDNTSPITVTLSGDTFTGTTNDDFVAAGKVIVTNLPSGLTAVVTRTSSTSVSVTLTGTASSHSAANNVSNLTFTFQNSAFTGGNASSVVNYTKNDLSISFNDPTTALTSGNVLLLDGSADYVLSSQTLGNFGTNDFTLEVLVKTTVPGRNIIGKRYSASHGSFFVLAMDGSGRPGLELDEDGSGTNYSATFSETSVTDGNWHHVACTRNGTTLTYYVDGVQAGQYTAVGVANISNATELSIGTRYADGFGYGGFFNGSIDDVRLWDVARSQAQIAAAKDSYVSSTSSGLLANFRFDESSGSQTAELIINAENVGTLYGDAQFSFTPLPVELVSFTATSSRLNAVLQWKTATEVNNHGFEIQRSAIRTQQSDADNRMLNAKGAVWTKVGFVEGNGNTNVAHEYAYTDRVVTAGKYSYRLKQVDRDGKFGYSQEVEVNIGSAPLVFALSQNYPNPFNPSTNIEFTVPATGRATLKVYNIMGQEVAALFDGIAEAGMFHQSVFDASRFSSGVYFARLTSGNNVQIKRMMLLK